MRRQRAPSGSRYSKRRSGYAKGSKQSQSKTRYRLSRSMSFAPARPYFFKRTATYSDLTFTNVGFGNVLTFALNTLPNYAEFTALFDQYCISKCVVKFTPQYNQLNVQITNAVVSVPVIYTAIDTDGQNVPASGTDITQYATCRENAANKFFTRVVIPRCAAPVYRGALATAYLECPRRQWIDVNYPDVTHYGLIYFANPSPAANQFSYRVDVIYYFACKSVR